MKTPDELLEEADVRKAVVEAFQHLTEREQQAIYYCYLTPMTLPQIGIAMDWPVTGARVRQIRMKAVRKILRYLWHERNDRKDIVASYREHFNL